MDYTQFPAGTSFQTTWVVQNTGSETWGTGNDVRYMGAVANIPMHQGADIYDLNAEVQISATYNFTVSMIAPSSSGTYGELWEIGGSDNVHCQFYVYIIVP